MKRNRWIGACVGLLALTMSACSGGGTKTLSEDDFADQLDDICRDATKELKDVDASDEGFIGDISDVIDTALDSFADLTPPKALADDFDDFVSNLEDQQQALQDIDDAIRDSDTDALTEASDTLGQLATDGDDLADSLGARRCVGVGESIGAVETPDVSIPDVSIPDVSIPDVSIPDETTANTPLPIDTTPEQTTPPTQATTATTAPPTEMTEPPMDPNATGEALDASQIWAPPASYEWGVLDNLAGILTPSVDPTIAPILVGYSAGIVHSTSNAPSAVFFITEVNTGPWTQEQIDALYAFSFGSIPPTEATTPLGLPALIAPLDDAAAALAWLDGAAIAVYALPDTDVLGLIDAFYTANTMQG